MNSIAGGGSFLSFPALILAGVPSIPANATNNTAMWVGMFGGARAYWGDVVPHRRLLYVMVAISIVGALLGATLLLLTPPAAFDRLIPWLLLFATLTFAASPLLTRAHDGNPTHQWWQYITQFAVAVYGGYFTAGIGILMLALLAFSGLPSFNATNGMKNVLSVAINGFAIVPFAIARVIDWRYAIPMAIVALLGGYIGGHFFRRVPAVYGRWTVIAIGAIMTVVFFVR
jgi:uncharacterized protein